MKDDSFYNSSKWKSLRKSILIRDKYMCQLCIKRGQMIPADCVHHIFPRDTYNQYQWQRWNLISLCSKCHDEVHNHYTGELSAKGINLLRSMAAIQEIPLGLKKETILVVGLRGSGKSTYCKEHLDSNSICYDMDAIASAFRLRVPHEEYFKPARKMANDFLAGFLVKAHDYCNKVYIIRTAPTLKEVDNIEPTKIVFCLKQYVTRDMDDREAARQRIKDIEEYAKVKELDCERLE